jgi:hypothetical protein
VQELHLLEITRTVKNGEPSLETRNENNIYLLLSLSEIKVNERIFSSVDHLN